jgi:hypothetical protein
VPDVPLSADLTLIVIHLSIRRCLQTLGGRRGSNPAWVKNLFTTVSVEVLS